MKKLPKQKRDLLFTAYSQLDATSTCDLQNRFMSTLEWAKGEGYEESEYLFRVMKVTAPQTINEILCLGIYDYIENSIPEFLLDALYTHNYVEYLAHQEKGRLLNTSTNSFQLYPVLNCIAGNNYSLAHLYLQSYNGKTVNGHKFIRCVSNIVYALLAGDESNTEELIDDAQSFVNSKQSKYLLSVVHSLIGVVENDPIKVGENLQQSVKAYSSARVFHDFYNDLNKFFPVHVVAIYSLARKYMASELFTEINEPTHFSWPAEFTGNYINHGNIEGGDLNIFSGELAFIQIALDEIKKKC